MNSLFGGGPLVEKTPPEVRQATQPFEQLAATALDLYRKSQAALRAGQWGEYGEALKKLEEILQALASRAKKE
jgi:uncharacterized membrane protein (UPF0182 family)